MKKLLVFSLMMLIFCTSCSHDLTLSLSHSAGIAKSDTGNLPNKPTILHSQVTLPMAKKT